MSEHTEENNEKNNEKNTDSNEDLDLTTIDETSPIHAKAQETSQKNPKILPIMMQVVSTYWKV